MHNIRVFSAVLLLTLTQATQHLPSFVAASAKVPSQADVSTNILVKFTTANVNPLVIQAKPKPDFDTEILAPLRAAQETEKKAAEAARLAKLRAKVANVGGGKLFGPATGDIWYQLRLCEAGNDYARNSGNGYYGAYQFSISSWGSYGGYSRPDLAPPAVQDAKAQATQAARGWTPWPACARRLGLL